jgi:hypothetical protein
MKSIFSVIVSGTALFGSMSAMAGDRPCPCPGLCSTSEEQQGKVLAVSNPQQQQPPLPQLKDKDNKNEIASVTQGYDEENEDGYDEDDERDDQE